jgi:hypothetical protein
MKSNSTIAGWLAFAALAVFNLQPSTAVAQGSLTPPGAPGPTMKTLQQIEPRTPISSLPYTISSSGSYYLTTNLPGSAGQDGIVVSANNVTLDLNGFVLDGTVSIGVSVVTGQPSPNMRYYGSGIHANENVTNLLVRNGSLLGWQGNGVDAAQCDGCVFERLRISGSGSWGLVAGYRGTVRD